MRTKYILATFYHVIVAQIPKKSKSSPPAALTQSLQKKGG